MMTCVFACSKCRAIVLSYCQAQITIEMQVQIILPALVPSYHMILSATIALWGQNCAARSLYTETFIANHVIFNLMSAVIPFQMGNKPMLSGSATMEYYAH
jgi:hypothetical protein